MRYKKENSGSLWIKVLLLITVILFIIGIAFLINQFFGWRLYACYLISIPSVVIPMKWVYAHL